MKLLSQQILKCHLCSEQQQEKILPKVYDLQLGKITCKQVVFQQTNFFRYFKEELQIVNRSQHHVDVRLKCTFTKHHIKQQHQNESYNIMWVLFRFWEGYKISKKYEHSLVSQFCWKTKYICGFFYWENCKLFKLRHIHILLWSQICCHGGLFFFCCFVPIHKEYLPTLDYIGLFVFWVGGKGALLFSSWGVCRLIPDYICYKCGMCPGLCFSVILSFLFAVVVAVCLFENVIVLFYLYLLSWQWVHFVQIEIHLSLSKTNKKTNSVK